jgi:hypothetical protein
LRPVVLELEELEFERGGRVGTAAEARSHGGLSGTALYFGVERSLKAGDLDNGMTVCGGRLRRKSGVELQLSNQIRIAGSIFV